MKQNSHIACLIAATFVVLMYVDGGHCSSVSRIISSFKRNAIQNVQHLENTFQNNHMLESNSLEVVDLKYKKIVELFISYDLNGDGLLTPLEVAISTDMNGYGDASNQWRRLSAQDANGDGMIDIQEFFSIFLNEQRHQRPSFDQIFEAFEEFDTDKDGFIRRGELMTTMALLIGEDFTEDNVEVILHQSDQDMDGAISLGEFAESMYTTA